MTPQEQWDDITLKLAQDRAALLKALKALVERVEEGGAVKREGVTGAAYNVWMANFGEDWCDEFNAAEAAIAQAERPR